MKTTATKTPGKSDVPLGDIVDSPSGVQSTKTISADGFGDATAAGESSGGITIQPWMVLANMEEGQLAELNVMVNEAVEANERSGAVINLDELVAGVSEALGISEKDSKNAAVLLAVAKASFPPSEEEPSIEPDDTESRDIGPGGADRVTTKVAIKKMKNAMTRDADKFSLEYPADALLPFLKDLGPYRLFQILHQHKYGGKDGRFSPKDALRQYLHAFLLNGHDELAALKSVVVYKVSIRNTFKGAIQCMIDRGKLFVVLIM